MPDFLQDPAFAKGAQVFLLGAYAVLAALFAVHRHTWPVALYYVGCLVKDSGVFALAFLMRWFDA